MTVLKTDVDIQIEAQETQETIRRTRVIDGFVEDVRQYETDGYAYVEISKVTNAIITLAAQAGANNVRDLEEAIRFLEERVEAEKVTNDLRDDLVKAEGEIDSLKGKLSLYGEVDYDVVRMTEHERGGILEVLEVAATELPRIPHQRKVGQKALEALKLLAGREATSITEQSRDSVDNR